MTNRRILDLRPASDDATAPAVRRKGRGRDISEKRFVALHDHARDTGRLARAAHRALAQTCSKADLGRGSVAPTLFYPRGGAR